MNYDGRVVTVGPLSYQWVRIFMANANQEYPVAHKCRGKLVEWGVADVATHCRIRRSQTPPASNAILLVSDTAGVEVTVRVVTLNLTER